MLTPEQKAHFDTFGFLVIRQAFSSQEMKTLTGETERMFDEHLRKKPVDENEVIDFFRIHIDYFVEQSTILTDFLVEDRIYQVIEDLLGPEFIWVGSEGNRSDGPKSEWHPDRRSYLKGEEPDINYVRIKVMIYLDKLTKDTGSIRFIPGSHRMPFHQELGIQEEKLSTRPFGVAGKDIPCFPVESTPGDIVFFNQCLWHAVFNGWKGRRFVAFKFAEKPTTRRHLNTLYQYQKENVKPHDIYRKSDHPRIRRMAVDITELDSQFT